MADASALRASADSSLFACLSGEVRAHVPESAGPGSAEASAASTDEASRHNTPEVPKDSDMHKDRAHKVAPGHLAGCDGPAGDDGAGRTGAASSEYRSMEQEEEGQGQIRHDAGATSPVGHEGATGWAVQQILLASNSTGSLSQGGGSSDHTANRRASKKAMSVSVLSSAATSSASSAAPSPAAKGAAAAAAAAAARPAWGTSKSFGACKGSPTKGVPLKLLDVEEEAVVASAGKRGPKRAMDRLNEDPPPKTNALAQMREFVQATDEKWVRARKAQQWHFRGNAEEEKVRETRGDALMWGPGGQGVGLGLTLTFGGARVDVDMRGWWWCSPRAYLHTRAHMHIQPHILSHACARARTHTLAHAHTHGHELGTSRCDGDVSVAARAR